MRVISNGFINCPIEISVDNHTLTVINSDGFDFEPVQVESIVLHSGERFDFIINANQRNDLYWMRFKGLLYCDKGLTGIHQVAVLQYSEAPWDAYPEGNPTYLESHKEGIVKIIL